MARKLNDDAKQVRKVIRSVVKLLDNPEAWTIGTLARTRKGKDVSFLGTKATCWCALGHLHKVVIRTEFPLYYIDIIREEYLNTFGEDIAYTNDRLNAKGARIGRKLVQRRLAKLAKTYGLE